MAKDKYKLVPASYLILRNGNQVLLLKRANTGYEDGKYSMVAGHVEDGETFTDTAIREGLEEAGIRIYPEDLKVAHVLQRRYGEGPLEQRIDVFFTADNWVGKIVNNEPHKCEALDWFDLDNLPENVIPYIKHVLECVKKGVSYSEFGW